MSLGPSGPARCLGFELGVGRLNVFRVFRRVGFETLENRKRPTATAERAPMATDVAVAADVRDPARIAKASKVHLVGATHARQSVQESAPSNFLEFCNVRADFSQFLPTCVCSNVEKTATAVRPARLPVRGGAVATVVDVVTAAWRRVLRHRIKLRHVECDTDSCSIVRPALPVAEIDELRQM